MDKRILHVKKQILSEQRKFTFDKLYQTIIVHSAQLIGHCAAIHRQKICKLLPKASYADRVFTTEAVSYPEIVHKNDLKKLLI